MFVDLRIEFKLAKILLTFLKNYANLLLTFEHCHKINLKEG